MRDTTKTAIQAIIAVDETIPKDLGIKAIAILGGTDPGEVPDTPISCEEAARMLNCTTRTLGRWVKCGIIRTIGKVGTGSTTRISKKSVLAFLAGETTSTAA